MKNTQPDLFPTRTVAARTVAARPSGEPRPGRGSPRSCKTCGICDPLPEGVSWAGKDRCSACARADYPPVARATYQTEPCPVQGCRGWRHPLATMCDACKSLLPQDLRLALMRSASAERRPELFTKYGRLDRPALQKQAIEEAAKARASRR